MKHLLLLAGILTVATTAHAEWVAVSQAPSDDTIWYVESSTLRKTKDGIKF